MDNRSDKTYTTGDGSMSNKPSQETADKLLDLERQMSEMRWKGGVDYELGSKHYCKKMKALRDAYAETRRLG